jgi:hypothetical protein
MEFAATFCSAAKRAMASAIGWMAQARHHEIAVIIDAATTSGVASQFPQAVARRIRTGSERR